MTAEPFSFTGTDGEAVLQVSGLKKSYGEVTALRGITFDVRKGELFGFLGPNGAGKTTTILLLTGLARADAGSIRIAGLDCSKNPKAAQHLMGIVPDESNLYPELSGFDNLCFCGALYGMRKAEREGRAAELLGDFGLEEAAKRKFGGYSKGMKRKLTIAAALMHRPSLLFLDEPTSGIDIASARQIRQRIGDLRAGGATIFLTTHYIEEAERLCDRIAFIQKGEIVKIDTLENLLKPVQGKQVLLLGVGGCADALCVRLLEKLPLSACHVLSERQLRLESAESISLSAVVQSAQEMGVEVTEAVRKKPSLEEVFLSVTGIEPENMRREKEKAGSGAL